MAQVILNQILSQLNTLEIEELHQLNQAIQQRLAHQELTQQAIFHKALLASGLVKQHKKPIDNQQPRYPLTQLKGKPVSQTIIEERR